MVSILSAVPFWAGRFIPAADYPLLLNEVVVMRHLHDPVLEFDKYYSLELNGFGYWGFHAPVYLLSWLLPIETAGKVSLSLFAISFVFGLRYLLDAFGRDGRLALLAVPLIYSRSLAVGLLAFLYTLPVLMAAIASWETLLAAKGAGPTRIGRGVTAMVLSVLTYLGHMWAAALLAITIVLLAVAHRAPLRRMWAFVPTVILIALGMDSEAGADLFRKDFGTELAPLGVSLASPRHTLRWLWSGSVAFHEGWGDDLLCALSMGVAAWLVVQALRRLAHRPDGQRPYRAGVALALGMLAFYSVLPDSIGSTSWLSARTGLLVLALCLLLTPSVAHAPNSSHGALLQLSVAALAIAHIALQASYVYRFQERAGPLADLIPKASHGGRTMGLFFDRGLSGPMSQDVLYHYAAYLQMHIGGDIGDSSARFSNYKLKYLRGMRPDFISDFTPADFRWARHGRQFDRILVFGAPDGHADAAHGAGIVPAELLPDLLAELALVESHATKRYQAGRWTLYEMR